MKFSTLFAVAVAALVAAPFAAGAADAPGRLQSVQDVPQDGSRW